MAQINKAQQEAWKRQQEALAVNYPTRLVTALERATSLNFELEVRNSQFNLRDRDARNPETFVLTMAYTTTSQRALESLEYDLQDKEAEQAEAERVRLVRATALAKLTPEEKELLNLN